MSLAAGWRTRNSWLAAGVLQSRCNLRESIENPLAHGLFYLQKRRALLRGDSRGEDCARGGDAGLCLFEGDFSASLPADCGGVSAGECDDLLFDQDVWEYQYSEVSGGGGGWV